MSSFEGAAFAPFVDLQMETICSRRLTEAAAEAYQRSSRSSAKR
jgi:hypothetical protein